MIVVGFFRCRCPVIYLIEFCTINGDSKLGRINLGFCLYFIDRKNVVGRIRIFSGSKGHSKYSIRSICNIFAVVNTVLMAGSCDNIQRFPVDCTCNRTAIKSSIIGLTVVNLGCEGIESNGYTLLCHIQIGFCISIPGEIRLHISVVLIFNGKRFYRKGIIVEIGIDMVCGTACGNNCTVNFPFHVEGEREIFAGDLILYPNGICTFKNRG